MKLFGRFLFSLRVLFTIFMAAMHQHPTPSISFHFFPPSVLLLPSHFLVFHPRENKPALASKTLLTLLFFSLRSWLLIPPFRLCIRLHKCCLSPSLARGIYPEKSKEGRYSSERWTFEMGWAICNIFNINLRTERGNGAEGGNANAANGWRRGLGKDLAVYPIGALMFANTTSVCQYTALAKLFPSHNSSGLDARDSFFLSIYTKVCSRQNCFGQVSLLLLLPRVF